jgi:hypothetical protein
MSATRWTISFPDEAFTASTNVSSVTLLRDGQRPHRSPCAAAAHPHILEIA